MNDTVTLPWRDIFVYILIPWAGFLTVGLFSLKSQMRESDVKDNHILEILKEVKNNQKEMKLEIDADLKILNSKLERFDDKINQMLINEVKFFKTHFSGDNGPLK